MVDADAPEQVAEESIMFPVRVGDKLRAARTKAGMDLADIATRTRIPQRHLAAIESGDYAALPGATYCIGFVKAFARVVGEDEVTLAHDLRIELGMDSHDARQDHADYDTADPTRVPSKTLAWTGLAIALLIGIAYGVWRSGFFTNDPVSFESNVDMVTPTPATPAQTRTAEIPVAPNGAVLLTAKEAVWFRIYDKNDKVLFEGEKKAGESFAVPSDALDPMIRTGRADQIRVTIGGKDVAPLGPAEATVKDVGVSAAALTARTAVASPVAPITSAVPPSSTQP